MKDEIMQLKKNRFSLDKLTSFYVYALWYEGEIVYIGKTLHLHKRLGVHLKDKKFTEYSYIECSDAMEMDSLESNLIMNLQPKYNVRIGSGFESLNKLRGRIKNIYEKEGFDNNIYMKRILKILKIYSFELIEFKGQFCIRKEHVGQAIKHIIDHRNDRGLEHGAIDKRFNSRGELCNTSGCNQIRQ